MSDPGVTTEQHGHKRLADFVRESQSSIVREWVEFARTISPASEKMSKLALEDHIVDILRFIADDLESAQTPARAARQVARQGP